MECEVRNGYAGPGRPTAPRITEARKTGEGSGRRDFFAHCDTALYRGDAKRALQTYKERRSAALAEWHVLAS